MRYMTLRGGALGADQAEALLTEVLLHLDLMRDFDHRREHPPRRLTKMHNKALYRVQCDFRIVWHAGRALELALHRIYAVANNKILGRDYPGALGAEVRRERSDRHRVKTVYCTLVNDCAESQPDLGKVLEHCYQEAFHKGVEDVLEDGKWYWNYITDADSPFLFGSVQQVGHGREVTIDHSVGHFYNPHDITRNFAKMPPRFRNRFGEDIPKFWKMTCDTFPTLLDMADKAYYGKFPMRYADYWWRDHEDFRPYIRVGVNFFDRLVENLVRVARQTWIMEESYFQRQVERLAGLNRRHGKGLIEEWSDGAVLLPDQKIPEEDLRRHFYPDPSSYDYSILHRNNAAKRAAEEKAEAETA